MIKAESKSAPETTEEQPLSAQQSPPAQLTGIRGLLARNQDLLRNAGSLAASTGLTSVLGFAFWIYAARVFTTEAVGYGSAAISTMTLLGTIGMFGLGTMLIGELPRRKAPGPLMMAALIASFIGSLILGVGFSLASLAFGSHFVEISGTFGRMLIFSLGVAITGATLVFDDASIGLMRGGLQLTRNVVVSIAKMVALPACGLILHDAFGVGIMLSWSIGTVVSVVPVIIMIKRGGSSVLFRPDWKSFWQLGKVTLAHNWLNLAITVPTKLIPVLTVLVVSPSSNAAYYVAMMLASFLFMVPLHLSTVLFAIASAEPEAIAEKLRFVLRMSLGIGIPGGLVLGLSGHLLLSVFGSSYASLATGPLLIILIGYIPGVPNTVYIAVSRAAGRVNQAAVFLSAAAAAQLAAVVIGGKLDGLYGISYGLLAVGTVEALVTTGPVLRTAFGRAGARIAPAQQASQSALREDSRRQQEAGLAALVALATAVSPTRRSAVLSVTGELQVLPSASAPRTRAERALGSPSATAAATSADLGLADASWWHDESEEAFRARQEAGIAALLAMATHPVRI